MSRQVEVTVPHHSARTVLDIISSSTLVSTVTHFTTQEAVRISFKVRPKHLQSVVDDLTKVGCGETYGTIDVFPLIMSRPIVEREKRVKRSYVISDRMTIDEIQEVIEDGNHLTFDFLALIAMASMIAGAGLLSDSPTSVIASMLVSPLMGPILSMTFGVATNKTEIIRRGLRNETAGVVVSLLTGLIMGFCASPFIDSDFQSNEMESRGKLISLIMGFIVAAPSGVAVILAVSKGGFNAIVGTAISASLLPPIVNSGLCLALGIQFSSNGISSDNDQARKYLQYAGYSLLLWFINFVIIVIVGFLTFRYVKNVNDNPLLPGLQADEPERLSVVHTPMVDSSTLDKPHQSHSSSHYSTTLPTMEPEPETINQPVTSRDGESIGHDHWESMNVGNGSESSGTGAGGV